VIRGRTEAHGRTASSVTGNGGRRQKTCLENKASKPIETARGQRRPCTRNPSGRGGEEAGAADREQLRGVRASWGTATPAGTPPSGARVQADGSGNTVNPRIGSGLQQCPHRQDGGNRRGGEKPRGRNGTHAGGTAGPKMSCFGKAIGSGRPRRSTDGGDLEEETRRSRRMKHTNDMHSCMTGGLRGSQRAGRAGSAKEPGGRPSVRARAGRDDAEESHQTWWNNAAEARQQLSGCDRAHGKTSNTRPATVKVREGAGKANDPLPRTWEAHTQDSSERLDTWKPRPASCSVRRATRA